MDAELLARVREALNARVTGSSGVNIVIPVSDDAAQRALNLLEYAIKSGLLDYSCSRIDADKTNVRDKRDKT